MPLFNSIDLRYRPPLRSLVFTAALMSLVVGCSVLIGWAFNIPVLRSIHPDWIAMKVNTALCFIFSGIALMTTMPNKFSFSSKLRIFCALFVGTFSFLNLMEYVFNISLGIDELFFKEPPNTVGNLAPGRMAFATAFSFVSISLAIFGLHIDKKIFKGLSQLASLVVLLLCIITCIGYICGANFLIGIAFYSQMALNTACTLFPLGIAFFILHSAHLRAREEFVRLGFVVGLMVLILVGIVSHQGFSISIVQTENTNRTAKILSLYRDLITASINAETGERGYIITGDLKFLEPYQQSHFEIETALRSLTQLAKTESKKDEVEKLSVQVNRTKEAIDQIVSTYRKGQKEVAKFMVKAGRDKVAMDELRSHIRELEEKETAIHQQRMSEASQTYAVSKWITVFGSFFAFCLVLAASLIIQADLRRRKEIEIELQKAKEEALKASESKSNFLANMSHEIRTPLNAIVGISDVMMETPLNAEQKKYLKIFQSAGNTLLNLINDILDISKIESGKLEYNPTSFDLHDLVRNCIELLSFKASQKGIRLTHDISPQLPRFIISDSDKIRQVLVNLTSNAVKFTKVGSVDVKLKSIDGKLLISVTDTGIGMDVTPEEMFQKFTQANSSIASNYGGTGLGLAISKQLVTLLKGKIWFESKLNVGTTFFVEIPLEEDKKAKQSAAQISLNDLRPLKILLVDDSPDNRLIVLSYLKNHPYEIEVATNGKEAVQQFVKGTFDLVLMDMHMPEMDGFEATARIRAWEKENNKNPVRIIALTAYALEDEKQKCFRAGCDLHLTKPIKRMLLLETISQTPSLSEDDSIDPEIQALAVGYLENRSKDLESITKAFASDDFKTIERLGHNMKGSAKSYGFAPLGDIGKDLELAAKNSNKVELEKAVQNLRTFLLQKRA